MRARASGDCDNADTAAMCKRIMYIRGWNRDVCIGLIATSESLSTDEEVCRDIE